MKFQNLSDYADRQALIVALYGRSGSGKTTLAATAERSRKRKMVVIDTGERGLNVIPDKSNIIVREITNATQALAELPTMCDEPEIKKAGIVVLDSMHTLRELFIAKQPKNEKGELDWAKITNWVTACLIPLMEVTKNGTHLILTSHDTVEDGAEPGQKMTVPSMGKRTINAIVGKCDITAHLRVEEIKRIDPETKKVIRTPEFRVYLKPNKFHLARMRVSHQAVPEYITNATLPKIFDIFFNRTATPALPPTRTQK